MNLIKVFQLSAFILLEIWCATVEANQANCEIKPTNVDQVKILVYINGGTYADTVWYDRFCSWRDGGFPFDQYAPITIKVGAEVICDEDNKCNCPSDFQDQVDCTLTFQHVCAQQILGQDKFENLLCCSVEVVNWDTGEEKGFQKCVDEQAGLADQISSCMEKQGSGSPQDVASKNSKELVNTGVDITENEEPYFIYNGIFDECISKDSQGWFVQKICLMLKYDIAKNITDCVKAMGWKP